MNGASGSTQIKSDLLVAAADAIESQLATYENQVGELYTLGTSLDSMWDGDANESFNAQMSTDRPKFDNLCTQMKQYVKFLRDTAQNYEASEQSALNIVSTNTIRKK